MTSARSSFVALCVALCLAGFAARAEAQAGDDARKKAKALYLRAEEQLAAGLHDEAIASYLEAYDLAPAPALLYNVGQAYRRKGDRQNALLYYQKYLAAEPNGKASGAARQNIDELTKEIAVEETGRKVTWAPVVVPGGAAVGVTGRF